MPVPRDVEVAADVFAMIDVAAAIVEVEVAVTEPARIELVELSTMLDVDAVVEADTAAPLEPPTLGAALRRLAAVFVATANVVEIEDSTAGVVAPTLGRVVLGIMTLDVVTNTDVVTTVVDKPESPVVVPAYNRFGNVVDTEESTAGVVVPTLGRVVLGVMRLDVATNTDVVTPVVDSPGSTEVVPAYKRFGNVVLTEESIVGVVARAVVVGKLVLSAVGSAVLIPIRLVVDVLAVAYNRLGKVVDTDDRTVGVVVPMLI